MKNLLYLTAATFLGYASGHGGVFNYTIDGVEYPGHYPWLPEEGQNSIQRRWWPDPMESTQHAYLGCNRGIPLATKFPTLHAPIRAGGIINARHYPPPCPPNARNPMMPSVPGDAVRPIRCFGPEYNWPHAAGPILAYMANCNGPCDKFDPKDKKVWFKIYQSELEPGTALGSSRYGQAAIAKGLWNVTVPRNLKPGNYLIRHEIIMIELWPPQFYPQCAQLTVTGDGDKEPTEDYLVSFPGAYADTDPGIAVSGTLYYPIGHNTYNYTVPGPKVWKEGN